LFLEEVIDDKIKVDTVNEEKGGLPVTLDDWFVWMGISVEPVI
jgi:hypothetical protein